MSVMIMSSTVHVPTDALPSRQVRVDPRPSDHSTTLPATGARGRYRPVRGAGSYRSISVTRARTAAKQLHPAAAVDRRDRQIDRRYMDAHRYKLAASIIKHVDMMRSFHMSCQRQILEIKWYDHVMNSDIAAATFLPNVNDIIAKRPVWSCGEARRQHTSSPDTETGRGCQVRAPT